MESWSWLFIFYFWVLSFGLWHSPSAEDPQKACAHIIFDAEDSREWTCDAGQVSGPSHVLFSAELQWEGSEPPNLGTLALGERNKFCWFNFPFEKMDVLVYYLGIHLYQIGNSVVPHWKTKSWYFSADLAGFKLYFLSLFVEKSY